MSGSTGHIDAWMKQNLPVGDSTDNNHSADVIGNKEDATVTTVGIVASLIAYIKGILVGTLGIDRHHHHNEDVFGLAVTPNGEIHRADNIINYTNSNVINPFQINAGNDNWGSWVQIFGSGDTPHRAGMIYFDFDELQIVDSGNTNVHAFIQIAWGESGAAGLAAGNVSTTPYLTPTNQAAEGPVRAPISRIAVGTKVWARLLAVGENTMTLDFYPGLHEYPL